MGDALQALAFQILASHPRMTASPAQRLRMIEQLGQAAGSRGMVGGQALDLAAVGQQLTEMELENMHIHKTGALIRASVLLAAYSVDAIAVATFAALGSFCQMHWFGVSGAGRYSGRGKRYSNAGENPWGGCGSGKTHVSFHHWPVRFQDEITGFV